MRSAARSAGSTTSGSDPRPTTAIRNVALAILGAAVLVLKSGYHGPSEDVIAAYAGNVAVSFALYFAAINATSRYGRSLLIAAALTLLAVELFEVTNGFGVMENVYDPADLIANAAGIGLAVTVDIATAGVLWRRHERPDSRSVGPAAGGDDPSGDRSG
jgi:glycopeptide antibiotics resistance protein